VPVDALRRSRAARSLKAPGHRGENELGGGRRGVGGRRHNIYVPDAGPKTQLEKTIPGEARVSGSDPYAFRMSPVWLIVSYAVVTLGELNLSPMGLSLVSKVAPVRLRGVMMGGWFVATAIGNKLTMIGVFWEKWLHSTFFGLLGLMAIVMAAVLLVLQKPLRKAMPGV
jgi:hypothetical protein